MSIKNHTELTSSRQASLSYPFRCLFPLSNKILVGVLTLFGLTAFTAVDRIETGKLVITVDNINKTKGTIWIGLYNSADNYLIKEKSILKKIEVKQKGSSQLVVDNLPFGTYAVALFHDINANGEMDKNLLGIPSEPYAFSKKPKSKWRIPKFDEVKFHFSKDRQQLKTKLKKWWD